jgi:prevent-host-death family protein
MKYSESVKPISYVKAHAAKVIREISENKKTMVITQNGEAKAVLQDVRSYEQTQESMAFLKILALSNQSLQNGKSKSLEESFRDIQKKMNEKKRK